jgi:hypothetical protein
MPAAKLFDDPYFTQQIGGLTGVTLRATQLGLGKLDRASTQIYWAIAASSYGES